MTSSTLHPILAHLHTLNDAAREQRSLELAYTALHYYAMQDAHPVFLQHNAGLTYRVEVPETSDTFLLKIYAPVGLGSTSPATDELEAKLQWLAVLDQHSELIVQTPIPNQSGRLSTWVRDPQLSEPFLCSLQQWVEGEPPHGDFTPQQLESIGITIAQLHNAASQCRAHWPDALPRFDPTGILEWAKDLQASASLGLLTTEQCAIIAAAGARLQRGLADLEATPGDSGPIHGDIHHANLIFHKGQARLIDFDSLQIAPYILDLGTILYHIHYQGAEARHRLLAAYRHMRPSQRLIGRDLDLALLYATLGNLAFQIRIPEQWPTVVLARNLQQLAEAFCRPFLAGEPILT